MLKDEHVNVLAFHVGGTGSGHDYAQLVCDPSCRKLGRGRPSFEIVNAVAVN